MACQSANLSVGSNADTSPSAEADYESWDDVSSFASQEGKDYPKRTTRLQAREYAPSASPADRSRASGRRGLAASRSPRQQLAAYPGALPSEDEELWIIQKAEDDGAAARRDDGPRSGALLCKRPQQEETIPVPLEHTDVDAYIGAYIATVDVAQKFTNPYNSKIEAVYVFPLPQNAAINEFLMTIGERRIRGIIRDREEAKKIYDAAKRQGHVASLLTQERPNV
ncbi:MAG: hypothetical protein KDA33_15110, partial [Phycisphaerales bacterium]|nr:hypothetical protein [Phycisphaerales bacterium]